MDPKQKLIQALLAEQTRLGLSQEQFAEKLGINRSTWNWVRGGVNNPGLRVLSGIVKSFPELNPVLIEYLEAYDPENDLLKRAS